MASSDFVRDKLIEWNLSKWIKNFEDEDINEEGFRLLTKQDYEHLIPKLGPRNIFRIKHKEYVKKCQKSCNDDKNIQVATLSSASIIKASKSSSGNKREKSSTVDEKIKVATLSSASIFTGSKISSGNAEITCQMAKGNHTPKKSKTKRTMTDVESNKKSIPITNTSEVNMPSTSMGHNPTGKRKSDLAQANKQSKKQKGYAASGTTSSLEMKKKAKVKEIMQSVRRKLSELPSTELIEYIKDKVEMLEKHKKQIVGVFGKTGAGKSSLINTILGETKLLPSGNQGACTSAMIQVEANMTNDLYIAEIEFITVKDWEEELSSIFISRSFEEGRDEDKEGDDDDDDENDDEEDEKITALYGKDGRGKNIKELMEKKHFKEIPEFYSSRKKLFFCHTDEELSEKITSFTRSDTQSATCTFKQHYWPLVKCITIKVPNCNELLEHVVLVDLPGNGDCNKGRDEMWKSFVGNCSAVWIVSDISRATSEKESWEILDSTARLLGPGGECRRIGFICTKTDDIGDNQNVDAHTWILNRNKATKIKVTEKFNKNKEVKKHFSGEKNFFQVFTVSSKEYKKRKHLEKSETEIPHLQEFLRNLNDHCTRTSDYISGACGILSLIQGAKSSDMTDSKEKVWRVLEKRLQDKLKSIEESIEEPYQVFDRCLLQGVQQSEESCEKLINKVIEPKGKKGGGFHKVLKSLCKNYGVYKQKGKKNRRKEINLNETLVSCMRSCIDEEFKNFFPNDKCGPIREQVENFTLDTKSLVVAHPSVSLHLEFLKTEERELKAKLVCDLREKKKKIYFTLTESVMDSMHSCYRRASAHTGKDTLKRMKDEIRHHVKTENIFQKAKDDMLKSLTNLKDHILNELKRKLQESIEISLKKPNSSFLPDVTKEYNNIQKLKVCSIILPLPPILDLHPNPTGFQFQLLEENRNVQTQQMQLQAQQPCLSIPIPMYQPYFQPKEETLVKIVGPADLNSSNMQLKPTSLDKGSNDHRDLACLVPTGPTDAASGSGALSVHPHTPEPALLPTEDGGPKTILNQLSDAAFVDKHRGAIIQRVKMVEKIADDLFLDDMIKDETYAKISEVSTTQEKMTTLLEAVHAGGTIVTSAFFKALQIYESPLVQDLGNVLTKEIA